MPRKLQQKPSIWSVSPSVHVTSALFKWSVCHVLFVWLQCNNPLTKEPKLKAATRIVGEWTEYDEEVKSLWDRIYKNKNKPAQQQQQHSTTQQQQQQDVSGSSHSGLSRFITSTKLFVVEVKHSVSSFRYAGKRRFIALLRIGKNFILTWEAFYQRCFCLWLMSIICYCDIFAQITVVDFCHWINTYCIFNWQTIYLRLCYQAS